MACSHAKTHYSPAEVQADIEYLREQMETYHPGRYRYTSKEEMNALFEEAKQVILDAGCGTGLAGKKLREKASRLVGVDISPKMLIKAEEKGIYDELVEMELVTFLFILAT